MKRVFKIMLSLLVILSGITVTTSMTATPVIARTVGDYTYTDNSDGTVTITNYGGSERDLTIPEELDGKTVSAIGYAAFAECRSLESVIVPETVNRLQDYAFSQCTRPEQHRTSGEHRVPGQGHLQELHPVGGCEHPGLADDGGTGDVRRLHEPQ